jgi:hypothetical protein
MFARRRCSFCRRWFYPHPRLKQRQKQQRGISLRVGMEATGYSRWFERLLAELGFEVWIGDAVSSSLPYYGSSFQPYIDNLCLA